MSDKPKPKTVPGWMQQVTRLPKGSVTGARSSEYCDCGELAKEAWGEMGRDSGLTALAYLWRRFGPSWAGGDSYKDLCSYWLCTPDREVWLTINLSGAGLEYSTGYLVTKAIQRKIYAPMGKWSAARERWFNRVMVPKWTAEGKTQEQMAELYWGSTPAACLRKIGRNPRSDIHFNNWRKSPPVVRRVNEAVLAAMAELLRPVFVRDCPLTILGRCDESDIVPAESSPYAGYGIPKPAMDKWIRANQ